MKINELLWFAQQHVWATKNILNKERHWASNPTVTSRHILLCVVNTWCAEVASKIQLPNDIVCYRFNKSEKIWFASEVEILNSCWFHLPSEWNCCRVVSPFWWHMSMEPLMTLYIWACHWWRQNFLFYVCFFFCRPSPPLPKMHISEDMMNDVAAFARTHINALLLAFQDVALGKDTWMYFKVAISLLLISIVGSLTDFLTLGYTSKFHHHYLFPWSVVEIEFQNAYCYSAVLTDSLLFKWESRRNI